MGARTERKRIYPPSTRLALAEDDLDQHDNQLADHETRIRGVERFMWKVGGAAALGGALAGFVTAVVTAVVVG